MPMQFATYTYVHVQYRPAMESSVPTFARQWWKNHSKCRGKCILKSTCKVTTFILYIATESAGLLHSWTVLVAAGD